ncbi:hypothetical protein [Yonghaparkia sp. Root332]|uniref:hypothetical protein n=1 Tax=Yonghaparkia sp. Root332 TaxID=1736516 RepID=UPI0006FB5A68|nr:hypothetical protein [Yonghaparkia sp. Root332]KQV25178.1 hypothetical protein ASC54_12065 [Yonghaparkia sp. Root332]
MSDDASRADARPDTAQATSRPVPTRPPRPFSVMQSLLLSALIGTIIGGLAFQLGLGDTSFDRPGQVVLLFIDVAPVLWFAAAPIIMHALRWRAIDQRFRWLLVAAVAAAALSIAARLLITGEGVPGTLLDPFTAAFVVWIAAALQWTRTRVKRLAAGTDRGITVVGMALGFGVAAVGLALGTLRLVLVGPEVLPGAVPEASTASPTTALLIAATFAMIAGLFWLTDRTRNR